MSDTTTTTNNTPIQQDLEKLRELIIQIDQAADRQQQTFVGTQSHILMEASAELMRLLAPAKRTLQNLERRLNAQEKEQQQLRALQDISAVLNSSLDTSKVLNMVMDTMIKITGAERGFLMLFDEDSGELEVQAARNIKRESILDSTEVSSTVINAVFETGEPLVTTNAQEDARFQGQQSIISYNLRSIMCVPLTMKDDPIGVIYADNRIASGIFNDADRNLFASFANQAAVAIENARLFRQIREQLEEITEMKTLMDDVFESIASGVITVDNEDNIRLYNQAASRILGVPMHAVVDRPYRQALADVSAVLSSLIEQVRQTRSNESKEVDIIVNASRATSATLNLTLSPLIDMQQRTNGIAMVLDDVTDRKRMAAVRRYLPPALVDQVRDLDAAQRPQRRELTVFFADISSFSTFSEGLDPAELIRVINGYFTVAAQAINEYEGIIDKFMGDAVMALFNTQLNPQDDHIEKAVRAGLRMLEAVAEYRERQPEHERLHFSAGINSGEAVAGNVGSHFRKDFTAIGDAVNLAKRLEETAASDQIIISSRVYEAVKDWTITEPLEPMRVKGRHTLEQTYLLLGEKL
jgi:adenylate cyclase